MSWLKRNLPLTMGILGAVALLGVAGFFLFQQYSRNTEVSTELSSQEEKFTRLNTADPSVTEENVTVAQQEQKRMADALQEARKFFAPISTRTNIDTATFKQLLDTTVFELDQLAKKQGVRIPDPPSTGGPYAYTFGSQYSAVSFDVQDLIPLSYQLLEVKAIVTAVLDARVHTLIGLRRPPVNKKEQGTDMLTFRKPSTNQVAGAAVTPYEVTFHGFSSELATVIDGLLRSPCCFIIKNINVERAGTGDFSTTDATEAGGGTAPVAEAAPGGGDAAVNQAAAQEAMRRRYGGGRGEGGGGMSLAMRQRYGLDRRGPVPTAPTDPAYQAGAAVPAKKGPETILNEQLLKITMLVDSVRLGAVAAK